MSLKTEICNTLDRVPTRKRVTISGLTYQDNDLKDSEFVDILNNGLNDSLFSFDSQSGTLTFSEPVTTITVTILY